MKKRYFVTGLLTAIPLWITWLLIGFIFRLFTDAGIPLVDWITQIIRIDHSTIAGLMQNQIFKSVFATILVLVFLYILGWLTTKVIGRKIIKIFDDLLNRIPIIKTIYGGSKKILESFQKKPESEQQVALINYPSPEMKAIGIVTKMLNDTQSGEKLAAVYVPTTPNPTSGFLEIVPFKDIILIDWTVNEAISFIVSGGIVGPEMIKYHKSAKEDKLKGNNEKS